MSKIIKSLSFLFIMLFFFVFIGCNEEKEHQHEFSEWKVIDATCEKDGEKTRSCSCGEIEKEVIEATGHTLTIINEEKPTCESFGWNSYEKCTKCDYTTYVELSATGHNYGEFEVINDATCEEDGLKEKTCSSCGGKLEEVIPATGHSYGEFEVINDATCEEDGLKEKTCSSCEDKIGEVIPAIGHSYGEFDVTLEPTCLEEGKKVQYCGTCGNPNEEAVDALGHDIETVEYKAATCLEAGNEAYEYCKRCDYTTFMEIPAPGHTMNGIECDNCDFMIGVEIKKGAYSFDIVDGKLVSNNQYLSSTTATYTIVAKADGIISFNYSVSSESGYDNFYIYLNNSYVTGDSGYVTSQSFSQNVKLGDELLLQYRKDNSSDYGDDCTIIENLEFKCIGKNPTCLLEGSMTSYNVITEECTTSFVDALGHDIISYDAFEATCTLEGYAAYEECSRCDYTTYQKTQDPLGHDITTIPAQDPTCEGYGWNEYDICSRCDHSTYVEIQPNGHSYGEYVVALEPTCTELGSKERVCSVCDDVDTATVDELGHEYTDEVINKTCETDGYTLHSCNRCDYSYKDNYQYAYGHFTQYFSPASATCLLGAHDGYEKCLNEGCTYTTLVETSPALGHDLTHCEGEAPTCESGGYAPYDYCNRCSYNTYQYLSNLGHDLQDWITVAEPTCTTPAYIESHCSRCDYYREDYDSERPALGHTYGEETEVPGTDYVQGYKYKVCSVCDYVHKYDFTETLITSLFKFEPVGDGYQLVDTNLTPEHTIVEIPAEYNGKPVTSIKGHMYSSGDTPFYGCEYIKKLIIPSIVTSIGYNSLSGIYNVEELEMPAACEKLKYAFYYAKAANYDNSDYPTSIKKVTITGTSSIGYQFFMNRSSDDNNIETIIVKDTVKEISSQAFAYCKKLQNLVLSEKITSIPSDAFASCNSLIYNVYDNAKYLGSENNPHLWLIQANSTDITSCEIHPDTLYIGPKAFMNCSNLTSIEIPSNIIKISGSAFSYCTSLTSVEIPDTVLELEGAVFSYCTNLTDVKLGNGFDTINGTFYNCTNLTTIVIPEGVKYIGGYAFQGCENLENVYIPKSAIQFGDTYKYNYNLKRVYYGGTFEEWLNIEMVGTNWMGSGYSDCDPMFSAALLYITNENGEYELLTEIVVPETLTELPEYQYYSLSCVTKVVLHEGIKSIDSNAFAYTSNVKELITPFFTNIKATDLFNNIESITFTNEFEELPARYFENCGTLKAVYLPETVKIISEYAFSNCYNLEIIELPAGLTTLSTSAFAGCSSLKSINIPSGITVLEQSVFYGCGFEEFIIPEQIEEVKYMALGGSGSLKKLVIPSSLTNLARGAISNSKAITHISMPVIGDCFGYIWGRDKSSYGTDYITPKTMTQIVLYGTEIPRSYFSSVQIEELIIDNTFTSFGDYLIDYASYLTGLYYMGTKEEWDNIIKNSNSALLNVPIYYYTDSCIHSKEESLWTFDEEGNVSIELSVVDWAITLEPTCSAPGSKEGPCAHCGETLTEELPMLSHNYENNKCTECGFETYSVTAGSHTFVLGSDGVYTSNNYHVNKSTAIYIITANVDMSITFSYDVSSESSCDYFNIYQAGNRIARISGKASWYRTKTVTLYAGQELKFEYAKDAGTHSYNDTAYFTIDSIVIY